MSTPSGRTIGLAAAIVVVMLVAGMIGARAQETEKAVVDDGPPRAWSQLAGRRVIVEGLAWGLSKGNGQRLILVDGSTVSVQNIDYLSYNAIGKPVRLIGRLRTVTVHALPSGYQQDGRKPGEYLELSVEEWSILDRVSDPQMREHITGESQGK